MIWSGLVLIATTTVSELMTLLEFGIDGSSEATITGAVVGLIICAELLLALRWLTLSLGLYLATLYIGLSEFDNPLMVIITLLVFMALAASSTKPRVRTLYLIFSALWVPYSVIRAGDAAFILVVLVPLALGAYVAARSVFRLSQRNSEHQRRLNEAQEQAERALREERKNIARDLHDIVAHDITIVAMQSKAAKFARNEQTARDALDTISKLSSETLHDLRLMLNVLRTDGTMSSGQGEKNSAPAATTVQVVHGAEVFSTRLREAGFTVTSSVDEEIAHLPRSAQTALYRVMQEATTNIIKHALPNSPVTLNLSKNGAVAVLEMINVPNADGKQSNSLPYGGSGLLGMKDRMNTFGGSFTTCTAENRWILRASIPF
ncbi:histidine kinase [Glutamicibacter sp. PS]|uniref:sensor histidine kinase n=1 Tax=Glutamicibacter sp. PS TaxID=3075634 RepID=UPI0028529446|nr:histidine kinase [Glutamicibacter sp. PS]